MQMGRGSLLKVRMRDIVMSIFSNLRTPWLVFETHRGQTVTGKPLRRRNLEIKAVVNYVSAKEAKELIAVDGFTVLDVRDVKQFDRAHIKSCHHVPLFIENKDNDLGKSLLSFTIVVLVQVFNYLLFQFCCKNRNSAKLSWGYLRLNVTVQAQ